MSSFGLQTHLFKQKFTKASTDENTKTVYTTENFVRNTVANHLSSTSSVNVAIGNGVSISYAVTGTNKSVVSVGLDAGITSLKDVAFDTEPVKNNYLMFDGSNWGIGTGVSVNDLSITKLSDFDGSIQKNSVLFSHNGTSIISKEDKSIQSFTTKPHNSGIKLFPSNSYPYTVRIESDPSSFESTSVDSSSDFYVITKSDGTPKKILKSDIDITTFKGFSAGAQNSIKDYLTATNGSSYSSTPGLCYTGLGRYNLNLTNYLSGPSGLLPISQGGTNAGSSADARNNLGLSSKNYESTCYPYQIMSYNKPEFRNSMVGDRIRLVPGISGGLSIVDGGTNYIGGDLYTIESSSGEIMKLNIQTGTNGAITSASIIDPVDGFPYLYGDRTFGLCSVGAGMCGTEAQVSVAVKDSYINFGMSEGEEGVGFRYGGNGMEVNSTNPPNWEQINKGISLGVSDLTDVNPIGSFTPGDFLIYTGTCFRNYAISGDISIGETGIATITSGISLGAIEFGTTITTGDFQNITGTTSKIQPQLDGKMTGTVSSPSSRDRLMILNAGTLTGAGVLDRDSHLGPDARDAPQIPVILPAVYPGVSLYNVYSTFTGPGSFTTDNISELNVCLLDTDNKVGTQYSLPNFLNLVATGAIHKGTCNQLTLAVENLEDYGNTIKSYEDYIAIGHSQPSTNIPNQKIHIQDLLKVPIAPGTSVDSIGYHFTGALAFIDNYYGGGTCYLVVAKGDGKWYGSPFTHLP